MALRISIAIVLTLVLGGACITIARLLLRKRIRGALNKKLFLVRVPQEKRPAEASREEKQSSIQRFEQLLANITSFRKPFTFEAAVPHVGEELHFYIAVPREAAESAVKQIQALWSGASVEPVEDDYTIFHAEGEHVAWFLKQKEPFVLPLQTYEDFENDPMNALIGGFAKIKEVGEGAALQITLFPASGEPKKLIKSVLGSVKRGMPIEEAIHAKQSFFKTISDAFLPGKKSDKENAAESRRIDESVVRMIEKKAERPLFYATVRIVASAGTRIQAEEIAGGIVAGIEQLSNPQGNALQVVKPRNMRKLIYRFIFRLLDMSHAMVLTSREVASMYHFPTPFTETPKVKWLKAKEAPPPVDIPQEGTVIGESVFRNERRIIRISDDDRRRHVYVVGQTGTGKSTLLANMIIDDVKRGKGVAMIDPHGDLAETVLSNVPRERMDDVIYFDPGDLSRPMGLNLLDYRIDRPEERTFIVNEMQGIFNKLFPPETMGPMFEQYMRNALLLLMEDIPNEPATLVEVPRVFTDPDYRERKLARIQNPVVVDFWEKEAVRAGGEASLANMTPYITSKFNNFIGNDYMRPIIGQPKSAFNFREAMDSGKILIVNLAKGKIGDINANLLGMIITGKILMASLSRADVRDPALRRDFYLHIDEFQNFTTDSISTILSEARKYRLNLTIAHQFIAQLTEKIRDSVFGNVGTQIVFRVGAQDAEFLVKQFTPTFNENDLVNIDNFNAYVKLLVRGETAKPFNIRTLPGTEGDRNYAEEIKQLSREKYGADRVAVEEDVRKRLRE